jgi:hypothetical protein
VLVWAAKALLHPHPPLPGPGEGAVALRGSSAASQGREARAAEERSRWIRRERHPDVPPAFGAAGGDQWLAPAGSGAFRRPVTRTLPPGYREVGDVPLRPPTFPTRLAALGRRERRIPPLGRLVGFAAVDAEGLALRRLDELRRQGGSLLPLPRPDVARRPASHHAPCGPVSPQAENFRRALPLDDVCRFRSPRRGRGGTRRSCNPVRTSWIRSWSCV